MVYIHRLSRSLFLAIRDIYVRGANVIAYRPRRRQRRRREQKL